MGPEKHAFQKGNCHFLAAMLCNQHLLNGLAHVQAHFHTVLSMVWKRLRQAGHTVVTVAKDFDPHTFIFLHKNTVSYEEFLILL